MARSCLLYLLDADDGCNWQRAHGHQLHSHMRCLGTISPLRNAAATLMPEPFRQDVLYVPLRITATASERRIMKVCRTECDTPLTDSMIGTHVATTVCSYNSMANHLSYAPNRRIQAKQRREGYDKHWLEILSTGKLRGVLWHLYFRMRVEKIYSRHHLITCLWSSSKPMAPNHPGIVEFRCWLRPTKHPSDSRNVSLLLLNKVDRGIS